VRAKVFHDFDQIDASSRGKMSATASMLMSAFDEAALRML
jgi:hypothetical protein